MLDQLKRQGYGLGIVTSRTREEYSRYFLPFHLESIFDHIICADDTKRHKPDPEPIYKYAELANVQTKDCLYVGDMPTDIECANRTGAASGFVQWNGAGAVCGEAAFSFSVPDDLYRLLSSTD